MGPQRVRELPVRPQEPHGRRGPIQEPVVRGQARATGSGGRETGVDGSKSRGLEGGLRGASERGRADRNSPDAPNLRQRRRRGCVQRRRSLKPSVMVYPDVLKQKEKINKKNICVGRDGPWQKRKKQN